MLNLTIFRMNKVLVVDTSESGRRLMSGLLMRAGYEPIAVDKMDLEKAYLQGRFDAVPYVNEFENI